jgi:hypothetical protein
MSSVLRPGSLVIVHLQSPTEKLWGVLQELNGVGVVLRALNVSSFDDWMAQAVSGEAPLIGLAAMFVPLARVERIFLDEQVGAVESYGQRFERRVGTSVWRFVEQAPIEKAADDEVPS